MKVKVGTRGSLLAVTQAKSFLKDLQFHDQDYELVIIKTTGDIRQEERFTEIGVKGIFVKELDEALLKKEIDFAIHSMKDLPSTLHDGIHLIAVSPCIDPRDAFISKKFSSLDALPQGSIVGSSSARRKAQLLSFRSDLKIKELRGNVETRIRKMNEGGYDAIILAAAGVKRMGLENEIRSFLDPTRFVPCIGQGIVAVTALKDNQKIEKMLKRKRNAEAMTLALLLREFMLKAQGGCSVPLGCHLESRNGIIEMWGYLSNTHGNIVIREHVRIPVEEKYLIVNALIEKMETKGFRALLREINYDSKPSSQE